MTHDGKGTGGRRRAGGGLSYGAMRPPQSGNWGPYPDPTGGIAVLRRAVELSVTLIDAAQAYEVQVQALMAEALHAIPTAW